MPSSSISSSTRSTSNATNGKTRPHTDYHETDFAKPCRGSHAPRHDAGRRSGSRIHRRRRVRRVRPQLRIRRSRRQRSGHGLCRRRERLCGIPDSGRHPHERRRTDRLRRSAQERQTRQRRHRPRDAPFGGRRTHMGPDHDGLGRRRQHLRQSGSRGSRRRTDRHACDVEPRLRPRAADRTAHERRYAACFRAPLRRPWQNMEPSRRDHLRSQGPRLDLVRHRSMSRHRQTPRSPQRTYRRTGQPQTAGKRRPCRILFATALFRRRGPHMAVRGCFTAWWERKHSRRTRRRLAAAEHAALRTRRQPPTLRREPRRRDKLERPRRTFRIGRTPLSGKSA